VTALIARAEAHSPEAGFGERIAENQRRFFQIAYAFWQFCRREDLARSVLAAYQKFDSLREARNFVRG